MLSIRLSRVGKIKYPTYRIIIQEKSRDPWGKALEILGNYNPHTKEFSVKQERIKYWLSLGAQMSATVNNLLIKHKIIQGKKMKAARLKKKESHDKKEPEKKETAEESKPEQKEEAKTEEKPTEPKKSVEDKKEPREEKQADEKDKQDKKE
jgi:small subunit ribosomal protein S16